MLLFAGPEKVSEGSPFHGRGTGQEIHFGGPISMIWRGISGEMRMAKVNMLGRGVDLLLRAQC